MVLATRYQLMLLIVWVLAIFYRTQFADVSLVDDYGALNSLLNQEHFSLREMFFPHSAGGGYYRPLIAVSYWLDKELWFLGSKNLHFESILGHLFNCILLFFSAQKACQICQYKRDYHLPLFVSLLFAVHPVVTESVNWISGRTDIMMGNFLLVSLLCILQYKLSRSRLFLVTGLLSAAFAMLAKETALGFIIGLPILLWPQNGSEPQAACNRHDTSFRLVPFLIAFALSVIVVLYTGVYWMVLATGACYLGHLVFKEYHIKGSLKGSIVLVRIVFLLPVLGAAILAFVAIRRTVFTSSVGKIGQTITLMLSDINYTISVFLGAIGFYVKKFFLPLPLNFFILEINPLYDLLGIAVFLGIIYLLMLRVLPAVFALIGFLLLAPALPFAFGTIAWSGYAERYIYLSTAFWILSIGLALTGFLQHYPYLRRYVGTAIILLCITAGCITYYRNGVWQSNVSLMKDTVAQTPNMRKLHDIYIRSLLNAGMIAEAEQQYRHALKVVTTGFNDSTDTALMCNDTSDLAIGAELVSQGRYDDALTLYQNALNRTKFASVQLLTAAIDLLRTMQNKTNITSATKNQLHTIEIMYVDKRSKITKNTDGYSTGEK